MKPQLTHQQCSFSEQVMHSRGPQTNPPSSTPQWVTSFHRVISAMSPQGKLATGRVLLLLHHSDRSVHWLPPLVRESSHLTGCCFAATARSTVLELPSCLQCPPDRNMVISECQLKCAPSFQRDKLEVKVQSSYHFTSCISVSGLHVPWVSDVRHAGTGVIDWHVLCEGEGQGSRNMQNNRSKSQRCFTSLWKRCVQCSSWTPPLLRMSSWQIRHSLSSSFCKRKSWFSTYPMTTFYQFTVKHQQQYEISVCHS